MYAVTVSTVTDRNEKDISRVSVLYVGYSPDRDLPPNSYRTGAGISDERYREDMLSRMNDFESLLKKYFGRVTTVDARDYYEGMSADYDVTVFDGVPKPVKVGITEKDPVTGRITRYVAPQYLSDGFSYAALFIAQNGPALGEPIGIRSDWYCMCLYSNALEINDYHPIFNEPLKVKIKMHMEDTPPELFLYQTGKDLPPRIPMWKVQTESSKDGKGYRIGVVSHGRPFMESPDCEYISGGQCMKEITAASIARHGNFLQWGFAASPSYMTKEAKKAFINAVYYISKFNGRIPILRAESEPRAPRSNIDYAIYTFSKQKQSLDAESTRRFVERRISEKRIAEGKKARGETLTASEKRSLDYVPDEPETWEKYIERQKKTPLVSRFNGDIEKTVNFLQDNKPYFSGANTITPESFDRDAMGLGIPNDDRKIIEEAIKMLESGEKKEIAEALLGRYTVKEFRAAEEWRKWYEEVKDHLFFSESNGYKFYADSYNNRNLYPEEIIGLENLVMEEPDDLNPVSSKAALLPTTDGNNAVVIRVKIKGGFHIYASASKNIPFTFFSVKIDLPAGMSELGEIRLPQMKPYEGDPEISVYKGDIVIMQKVTGASEKRIRVQLDYQYCNDEYCGLPVQKVLTLNERYYFNLNVRYSQPASDTLFFSYLNRSGQSTDTLIPILDGKGYLAGEMCHPYWARFNSVKYPANGGILLDTGKLILHLDTASYTSKVESSALNDEYRGRYRDFRMDLNREAGKFMNAYLSLRRNQDGNNEVVTQDSLNYLYDKYNRLKRQRDTEYIGAYPDSYLTLALARNMYNSSVNYNEIKNVYDLLSSEMKGTVVGRQLLQKVRAAKATMIGNMAPDIILKDSSGMIHRLSEYRGKYVFLDFYKWGCPPCEELMEDLKPVYAKYKNNGFVIFGIYHRTDDNLTKSRERWSQLLNRHKPDWINLFDIDNKACDSYGIEAFPSGLLIDPEGKIAAYEISLADLENILNRKAAK
ncbi:MAG: redoxin domain-containing protein [Bacteroidales bacterium]|nr:redoxin domain-containing protein [Bacteroidales bacterium]